MKHWFIILSTALMATVAAQGANAAVALAEASSASVSVDTTFAEGGTVSGEMQIKYGKVGGASGSRILVEGMVENSAMGSGTYSWTPTLCRTALGLELVDSSGNVMAAMTPTSVVFDDGAHDPVATGAIEPTCTEEGCTAEVKCSRCEEVLEASAVLPALGHERAMTIANGSWTSKIADPSAWVASENNVLRGLTPAFSGTRFNESGRVSSADPLSRLSDGVVNSAGGSYGNTVGISSGTLTWTLPAAVNLSMLRINTHWGDGGRDGLNLNSVQIQREGSSSWTTLANSSHSYGIGNSNSGSNLEFVFASPECGVLASDIVGIRFDLGNQDNSGSGFTEFEAVGLQVAPTCVVDGHTAEVKCSRCGEVLEESAVIPALGHMEIVTVPFTEPTSATAGHTEEITCSRCGEVLQQSEVIPALGYVRNVTARQIWPHKKVEVCYTLADDIVEVAEDPSTLQMACTVGQNIFFARTLFGDTSAHPGLHRVVWDMEADGVAISDGNVAFTVGYRFKGIASPGKWLRFTFKKSYASSEGRRYMQLSELAIYDGDGNRINLGMSRATTGINPSAMAPGTFMTPSAYSHGSNEDVDKLFDDNTSTKWCATDVNMSDSNNSSNWRIVTIRLADNAAEATSYIFYSANDATPARNPVTWKVEMSSDGLNWYEVDEKTDTETTPQSTFAPFNNGLPYTLGSFASCTSPSISVNTSSSVKDGMTVSGSMELGYSPINAGTSQLLVDGAIVLSSTNSGSFVWQPLTTGTHTLQHTAGAMTWTRTVNVTSVAFATPPSPNPPTAEDANISIGQTSRTFAQGGGSGTITTSGSGTWTASVSDGWITIPAALTTRNAGLPIAYTVSANAGAETRTGYIYISGHVYTITQNGVGATLDSTSASFNQDGGTDSFVVLAGAGNNWSAKPNVNWISISPVSGTGEDEVEYTVAPYAEVATRSGTITAAGCTFTVNQTGSSMKLDRIAETCDYQNHVFVLQLNAFSGIEWGIWLDSPWLSIVDGGTGVGGSNLSLAVAENPSYLARTAVAIIGTETFTVTQSGRPTAALAFAISPEQSTASVNGANAVIAVTATPDLPWSAASGANWLTVMPSFHSGSGNGNVIYSASPNPTMAQRTGTIMVTPISGSGMAAGTHTVVQPAATATIAESEHIFPPAGGSYEVAVTTDDIVGWSIAEDIGWISIDGETNRIGPDIVNIIASENPGVDAREATMTIAGHTFRTIQPGRALEVEYESIVFDCYDNFATIEVHPDGRVQWVARVSDPSWIVLWAEDGDCDYDADGNVLGVGDATLAFMVTQYVGDGMPRTGWIEIGDKVVYVTQRAFDLSISPSSANVGGNAGSGSVGVSASVGEVWEAIVTEPWITIVSGYNAGTGNGMVLYTFTDNNTGESRNGRIIIAGEEYTITQAARQLVTISADIQGVGGSVGGAGTYDRGTPVSLRAIAEDGCEFLGWTLSGGGTSAANPLAVTADVDKTIVARFRRIPLHDVNGEMVREGTVKTFTAPADHIDEAGTTKLVCIGSSAFPALGRSFSLTITEDISFEWDIWSTNYLLRAQTPANGEIKRNDATLSQYWANAGETVSLAATPDSGYSLFRWTGDIDATSRGNASLSLTMDAPKVIGAVFDRMTDTLAQAADAPTLTFTTGGDTVWEPVIDAEAQDGYTSVRSGAMDAECETWMDTVVEGDGVLSFRWRADCEKDDSGEATWDRLTVFTNGVEAARLDGRTGWRDVSLPCSGKTTIRWSFYRDDWDEGGAEGENCGWVDGVNWEAR